MTDSPLLSHLIELRKRLLRAVIAVVVVFAGLAYFANDLYRFWLTRLSAICRKGSQMIATNVAAPFSRLSS